MINTVFIVGAGFVGATHAKALMDVGINVKVYDIDKEYYLKWPKKWMLPAVSSMEEIVESDVIIVSVPTPPVDYALRGQCLRCNTKYVDSICTELNNVVKNSGPSHSKKAVILKSTVPIGYTKKLNNKLDSLSMFFAPEFLTENTPLKDLKYPDRIVFGSNEGMSTTLAVKAFYVIDSIPENNCKTIICNTTEAELIKLASNSLLATKVTYANMIYDLCQKFDINYKMVQEGIGADTRIGESHLKVPGSDGKKGFSGSCIVGDEYITIKENGILKIITLKELFDKKNNIDNLEVLSYNTKNEKCGEFKKINVLTKRKADNVFEIKTHKGRRIKATSDHKFIVYEDNRFIKKQLKDLKVGDSLPILNNYKLNNIKKQKLNLLDVVDKYQERFKILRVQLKHKASIAIVDKAVRDGIISIDQKKTIKKEKFKIIPYKMYKAYKNKEFKNNKIKYLITGKNHRKYPQQKISPIFNLNENFAAIVGYYMAEGYKTKQNIKSMRTMWSFGHTKEEQKYANKVVSLLKKCGFSARMKKKNWNGYYSSTLVCCQSNILHAIMCYLECGHTCYMKKFPDFILQDEKLSRIALSAYIEGDGCIIKSKQGYVSISTATASKILHQQIGHILHSYNIFPSESIKFGKKAKVASYQWYITNKRDIKKLSKHFNFNKNKTKILNSINNYKQNAIAPLNYKILDKNICLTKIKSITKVNGKYTVYSMKVKDNHNFITTSNLLVSNCFPKDIANLMFSFLDNNMFDEKEFLNLVQNINISQRGCSDWINNRYRNKDS